MAMVGCSSGDTAPTPPSASATIDITGTWVQEGADRREWSLTQSGIVAGGAASFAEQNSPTIGAVSGTGGVQGAVFSGMFRFAETYETLSIPAQPSPNYCSSDTDGQLAISGSGSTMTGSYTETIGCAGVHVSQVTRSLVMRRR